MYGGLDDLVDYCNPLKDLEGIEFKPTFTVSAGEHLRNGIYNSLKCWSRVPKHLTRGAIVGSICSSAYYYVSGGDVLEGATVGFVLGALTDMHIYGVRCLNHFFYHNTQEIIKRFS